MKLELCESNQYPLPSFFTFVFTNQDGKHLYVACLKFFEKIDASTLHDVNQDVWGESKVTVDEDIHILFFGENLMIWNMTLLRM
jgi:hypothetical protein